jgi:hypothetical protein
LEFSYTYTSGNKPAVTLTKDLGSMHGLQVTRIVLKVAKFAFEVLGFIALPFAIVEIIAHFSGNGNASGTWTTTMFAAWFVASALYLILGGLDYILERPVAVSSDIHEGVIIEDEPTKLHTESADVIGRIRLEKN